MAPNPMRAEGELLVGNETYRLALDVNAFCLIEKALGMKPIAILDEFENSPDGMLIPRGLLWGALQKHHDGAHMLQAGEIISDVGISEVRHTLSALLAGFFGVREKAEGEDGGRPPKRAKRRSTG